MTTIHKAIKLAEMDAEVDWSIRARVLCRQIFTVRSDSQIKKLLIIVLVDQEGSVMEVKTWNEKKAYTVYRKFKENSCLQVRAFGHFRQPNRKYSTARCELYSRWFLETINSNLKHRSFIEAIPNIHKFHRSKLEPNSILGLFYELTKGPVRKTSSGYIVAQGYYAKLLDECGRLFQVLVWRNMSIEKDKFSLNFCDTNSVVLILYAREQDERYRFKTPGIYTLTTTYPPVVNPVCINPETRTNLLKGRQTIQCEQCIPYLPHNDDI